MRTIWPILRPYRFLMILAIALVGVQAATELALPTLMATIVDEGIVNGDTQLILRIGSIMLVVTAVSMTSSVIGARIASRTSMAFGRDLRNNVFEHVTNFSLSEFDRLGAATLITRTTNDVEQVERVIFMSMRMFSRAPMMAIGSIFFAFQTDPGLAWILLAAIPVLGLVVAFISSKSMPLFQAMQEKIDRLNLVSREGLAGIRVIRAFNRTRYEEKRFEDANADLMQTGIRVNRIIALMDPALTIILNLTIVVALWVGAFRIQGGTLEVGKLMAFPQYAMHVMFSLMALSMMFVMIPRATVSAKRVSEVIEMVPEIEDPATPASPAENRGIVEFDNVTFYYPGAEAPALSGISFTAKPGEVTAIIGGIGSGKSTLAKLLLRFYDVTDGSIKVDGVDVRDMTQEELRSRIGYVPQQALLFTGTIAENLRYGKADATDDEVQKAAESAQAHRFVRDLEHGYDSYVAQGGTNLSGGQKQRLTIARALVRRPKIYLFDDNFSALDFKTDALVRQALRKDTADATVIIVAQRVATIMDATRIIVLDEGKVAGIGTHAELLQTCDIYREIVASQLAEEAIA